MLLTGKEIHRTTSDLRILLGGGSGGEVGRAARGALTKYWRVFMAERCKILRRQGDSERLPAEGDCVGCRGLLVGGLAASQSSLFDA